MDFEMNHQAILKLNRVVEKILIKLDMEFVVCGECDGKGHRGYRNSGLDNWLKCEVCDGDGFDIRDKEEY